MSALSLLITPRTDIAEWHVWISLPAPLTDAFGFVIGSGATRDEAVADAVAALEVSLAQLQGPRGVVTEQALEGQP